MGLVFRDFRNDANPGVKGAEVAGIVYFAIPVLLCARSFCTSVSGTLESGRATRGNFYLHNTTRAPGILTFFRRGTRKL